MIKEFLDFLRDLTDEILKEGKDMEEVLASVDISHINLFEVNEEIDELVEEDLIEEEEAETLKSILLYILMRNTDLDPEDIYAIVFGEGKRLRWH